MSHVYMPEGWKFIEADRYPQDPSLDESVDSTTDTLEAMEEVCRRMDVLAKELGCLGFFSDDSPEGPKAA